MLRADVAVQGSGPYHWLDEKWPECCRTPAHLLAPLVQGAFSERPAPLRRQAASVRPLCQLRRSRRSFEMKRPPWPPLGGPDREGGLIDHRLGATCALDLRRRRPEA